MKIFNNHGQKQAKRQLGSDKRKNPLPIIHGVPSTKKIALSRIAIIATILLWSIYLVDTIIRQFFERAQSFEFTLQAVSYLLVVTLLTFSALMYLIARQGALQRFSKHIRAPRADLESYFLKNQPSITVLIPSYSEEPAVIRKTILSAALQEYPIKRIVLLIDDKPNPANQSVLNKLNETRQLNEQIQQLLSKPKLRLNKAYKSFSLNNLNSDFVTPNITKQLAEEYAWAAQWLNDTADQEQQDDHVDEFFANQVMRALSNDLKDISIALLASYKEKALMPTSRINELYLRLTWIFNVDITFFERKKYASLSHEANKAMNLNSYIGLMGQSYKTIDTPQGLVLSPVKQYEKADLIVPDSDYLLTLDADSILLRDYCLRLVYFLEQPRHQKVAVTQTPYSSFRGSSTRLERLAAATTDIQHILHQGMTYYDATFWVGANAVIRKKALEDIVVSEWLGGFEIKRYIQDRTVIEDTESSIDLTLHGWSLVNYPERLSYSATPPDFGSLVVQRRRWANGGLLILPKLWKQTKERRSKGEMVRKTELLLRVNYMASIAWASFGLIFLLAYPYNGRLLSPFVLLAALPYFLAMASDLKYCGYKRSDVIRIYGFNLILLPVNLAGVLKSIQQAITGKKIPFARTPKVKNRTISPLMYVVIPGFIVLFSGLILWKDEISHNWWNAVFAGFNALLSLYAIVAFIGIKNSLVDIWHGLTNWMYVEVTPKLDSSDNGQNKQLQPDWRTVLYSGNYNNLTGYTSTNQVSNFSQVSPISTNYVEK